MKQNAVLRVRDYLGHIDRAIGRIRRYLAGVDRAAFFASEEKQDAVIRNIAHFERRPDACRSYA